MNNPSYYGRSQIEQYLPVVSNGSLQLTVQTYNPTGPGNSFLGSEIISNQTFTVMTIPSLTTPAGGIAFTAVAQIVDPVPGSRAAFGDATRLHDKDREGNAGDLPTSTSARTGSCCQCCGHW